MNSNNRSTYTSGFAQKVATCHTLMIGNPGTGKSSILNGIMKKSAFLSGVSLGKGLTQTLQEQTDEKGNSYIDTPGLSDIRMREKAAQEIKKALTKGGMFKVFFVITLEAGKIRPDDLTTMKLVLEAAPEIKKNCYGIIINKAEPEILKLIEDDKEGYKDFLQDLNNELPGTNQVYFNEYQAALSCKKNAQMKISYTFNRFLRDGPSLKIQEERVNDINVEDFEVTRKRILELNENNRKLQEKLFEQKKMQEKLERERKKAIEDYNRQLEEEKRELEKQKKEAARLKRQQEEEAREEKQREKSARRRREEMEMLEMEMLQMGGFGMPCFMNGQRVVILRPSYGGGPYGGGPYGFAPYGFRGFY